MLSEKFKKVFTTAKDTVLETAMLTSQIEIISNNHAVIQGAKGVLEYEVNMIRIKLESKENNQRKEIQFWGNDFLIEYLAGDCIEIRGEITKIEFI